MKKIKLNKLFGFTKSKNLIFLGGLTVFWWVFLSNVNVGSSDVFHDRDQDGLSDEEEYMYGTDINNPDSDGDGYRDGVEVESGYDPLKPAPGDKIFFKSENELQIENNEEVGTNLTNDFFEKLQTEKSNEVELLSDYYTDPESYGNEKGIEALNEVSLTSEELQKFINQTTENSELSSEMNLISEDDIFVLPEVTGNEEEVEKKEKEQIEKYLTQIFYVMSINKPFSIEDQSLLPQLGVGYINEISGAIQTGQTSQLAELKEKAQKTYDECLKIETPYKTKDIHIRTLSLIKYLMEDINEEKLVDQQDPMTIALYVGKLQAALMEGEALKNEIDELVGKYEIEIFDNTNSDSIF